MYRKFLNFFELPIETQRSQCDILRLSCYKIQILIDGFSAKRGFHDAGTRICFFSGAVAYSFLGWLAFTHDRPELTAAVWVVCGLLGWLYGILLSPEKDERAEFKGYREGVAVFVAGFASAKFSQLIDIEKLKAALATDDFQIQALVGIGAFLIGLLYTFIGRRMTPKP